MPEEGRLEGVVREPVAEGMDTLGVVDRVSEGQEVALTQRAERDAKTLTEELEHVVLIPDLEGQPGPQGLAQQTRNRRPVAEGISVGGDPDSRGAVGGGEGRERLQGSRGLNVRARRGPRGAPSRGLRAPRV